MVRGLRTQIEPFSPSGNSTPSSLTIFNSTVGMAMPTLSGLAFSISLLAWLTIPPDSVRP